jgi:RNA polymerase sigma-70 factor (ECF subfamily)
VSTSPDEDRLAEAFSQARPRLVRVAYAILGSHSEAEDVAADCWLRLVPAHSAAPVHDVESWAVVTVSRMALDVLRSARVRREQYVGPWLPEPVLDAAGLTPGAGAAAGLGAGSARMAADPAAVRQLASRARRHVRARGMPSAVDAAEHRRVVSAFAVAVAAGDLAALIRVLDPEVVLVSDGGGVVTSARRPVLGADRVGRFLLGILAKARPGDRVQPADVNGAPGFAVYQGDQLVTVVSLTVAGGRVARLDLVRAPGKLPRPPS